MFVWQPVPSSSQTGTRARVSWAEFEVPTSPSRARVSWTEFEVPFVPTRGRVSWTELEVPTAVSRGRVSWTEFEVPTAAGSIQFKVGHFLTPTTTGIQNYTVGFQPQVVLFFGTDNTTADTIGPGEISTPGVFLGWAVATNDDSTFVGMSTDTSLTSTQAANFSPSPPVKKYHYLGGFNPGYSANFNGFTADGFSLNWTSASGIQWIVTWVAIAGLEAVGAGKVYPPTSTGNVDYSVGFQPDLLFVMATMDENDVEDPGVVHSIAAVGPDGSSWCYAGFSVDGATSAASALARREQLTDGTVYLIRNHPDNTVRRKANFVQFLPNGFRLNHSVVSGNQWEATILWLALKVPGGYAKVGTFDKTTASAPASQDVNLPFDPKGVLFLTWGLQASASQQGDWEGTLGATDGTNHRSVWWEYKDQSLPASDPGRNIHSIQKAIVLATGPSTLDAAATVSLGSSKFTVNWDQNNTVATQICYAAVGTQPATTNSGRLSWAELEVPTALSKGRVSWTEFEVPTAQSGGRVSWTEFEVPTAFSKGRISWSEFEVPTAISRGRLSWAELEVPTAPAGGRVSWAEFETPFANSRGRLSWAELEVPTAFSRGRVSWSELEIPTALSRGRVSWSEFEVPLAPSSGRLSWAELEVPTAQSRGRVSWSELEVPFAPTRGRVSWSELEVPFLASYGRLSWAEFEIPSLSSSGRLSWTELELPFGPSGGRVSHAEFELPSVSGEDNWYKKIMLTKRRAGRRR